MRTGTFKRMAILGGIFLSVMMIPGAAQAKSSHWGFNYGPGGAGFHYGRGDHHGHRGHDGYRGHHGYYGHHYRPGGYYHRGYYPSPRYLYDYYPAYPIYPVPYYGGCYYY
jgi:hypothetical protein